MTKETCIAIQSFSLHWVTNTSVFGNWFWKFSMIMIFQRRLAIYFFFISIFFVSDILLILFTLCFSLDGQNRWARAKHRQGILFIKHFSPLKNICKYFWSKHFQDNKLFEFCLWNGQEYCCFCIRRNTVLWRKKAKLSW